MPASASLACRRARSNWLASLIGHLPIDHTGGGPDGSTAQIGPFHPQATDRMPKMLRDLYPDMKVFTFLVRFQSLPADASAPSSSRNLPADTSATRSAKDLPTEGPMPAFCHQSLGSAVARCRYHASSPRRQESAYGWAYTRLRDYRDRGC